VYFAVTAIVMEKNYLGASYNPIRLLKRLRAHWMQVDSREQASPYRWQSGARITVSSPERSGHAASTSPGNIGSAFLSSLKYYSRPFRRLNYVSTSGS